MLIPGPIVSKHKSPSCLAVEPSCNFGADSHSGRQSSPLLSRWVVQRPNIVHYALFCALPGRAHKPLSNYVSRGSCPLRGSTHLIAHCSDLALIELHGGCKDLTKDCCHRLLKTLDETGVGIYPRGINYVRVWNPEEQPSDLAVASGECLVAVMLPSRANPSFVAPSSLTSAKMVYLPGVPLNCANQSVRRFSLPSTGIVANYFP